MHALLQELQRNREEEARLAERAERLELRDTIWKVLMVMGLCAWAVSCALHPLPLNLEELAVSPGALARLGEAPR